MIEKKTKNCLSQPRPKKSIYRITNASKIVLLYYTTTIDVNIIGI